MLTKQGRVNSGVIPIALAAIALVILFAMSWSNALRSERGASDHFWSLAWVDGVQAEGYESRKEIYELTDAVVLGRLASISPGRVIGDAENDNAAYYVTVTLDIERVLRARPNAVPADGSVRLELVTFQEEVVAMMVEAFEPESGLFFLTSKGLDAARAGESVEVQAAEMPYYRLAVADGVLREIGGRAFTRPSPDASLFSSLQGQSFDSAIEEIESGS